jgi:hypothetical protein
MVKWEQYGHGETIVLADHDRNECDPYFSRSVSGVLVWTLRNFRHDLKTISKSQCFNLYLVDPHSLQEIEAISRITYRLALGCDVKFNDSMKSIFDGKGVVVENE